MANYLIGLDFGTSQSKVCLLNEGYGVREFLKFENDTYFLPSLIVKKDDNTFTYGNENVSGIKYRYFKMSAAEDDDLIQVTNESLLGVLDGDIEDFRKYSTDNELQSEALVVLYLAFIYLYVQKKKNTQNDVNVGGLLGRLATGNYLSKNSFSINLGIPTEWNNPDHIKRKIKFQSLLLIAVKLSNQFQNLEMFLASKETELLDKIYKINTAYLNELENYNHDERAVSIEAFLKEHNLSVFPESAAGINFLLTTQRLINGSYATLDIGAGTSDIAIFSVHDNTLTRYFCSESVGIASNDFYIEYARQLYQRNTISFDEIKTIENIIKNDMNIDFGLYNNSLLLVRGSLDSKGIEFAIRKAFYRKFYHPLFQRDQIGAIESKKGLSERPIIIFGGGANINGFSAGNYCYYKGSNPFGSHDCNFQSKPITDFVQQIDILSENNDIQKDVNLLVLALGLTYGGKNSSYIPFGFPQDVDNVVSSNRNFDRYFYYDLQEAAYK